MQHMGWHLNKVSPTYLRYTPLLIGFVLAILGWGVKHLGLSGDGFLRFCLALVCLVFLAMWRYYYQLKRTMCDTPTSKISAAAQGFVELYGKAEAHDSVAARSPITGLPCVWYYYAVYQEYNGRNRKLVDSFISEDSFLLNDGSGERCVIDPVGASIHCQHVDTFWRDDFYYVEHLLLAGDQIYALGALQSNSTVCLPSSEQIDLNEKITEWKREPYRLRQRFDANKDGHIDTEEWEMARETALQEVRLARQYQRQQQQIGFHLLSKPKDGRPFVLSNIAPEKIGKRYARAATLYLVGGCVMAAVLLWVQFVASV